jgi:hypothetical protein
MKIGDRVKVVRALANDKPRPDWLHMIGKVGVITKIEPGTHYNVTVKEDTGGENQYHFSELQLLNQQLFFQFNS